MRRGALVLSMLSVAACGAPAPDVDAGRDAAVPDAGPPPFVPTPISEPAAPGLIPCPAGWREVTTGVGLAECDPWPEGGRAVCGEDEAHLPGEPGCRRIGGACPADGVPADLPAGAIHVRPGAAGGDGSPAAPFGTIADALDATTGDVVLALASGSYSEAVVLRDRSASLIGACTETVFEAIGETPLIVLRGTLALRNLKVRGAPGAVLVANANLALDGVVLEDSTGPAVATTGSGSVDVRDVLVRHASGGGFFLFGATSTFERVAVEDVDNLAFNLRNGTLTARSLVVDGVRAPSGFASIVGDADVTIEGASFRSDPLASIIVVQARVRLADVIIRTPLSAGTTAELLVIMGTGEATLDLERVRIERAGNLAIGLVDPGTNATLRDVVIRDVLGAAHAIEVGEGASAVLERVLVERSGSIGLLFFGAGTVVEAHDVTVRDSRPDGIGLWGRGLGIQTGATLTGERIALSGNHEVGLVVASPGTNVSLTDVSITDTRERGCAASGCSPAGIGVGVYEMGALDLERFTIVHSALIGAQVATDGELDLTDGVVGDCPIGANVQVEGYEIGRLADRVVYRDNGTNLETAELHIPEPTVR